MLLRLFMEAFVEGLRLSFTEEDGDHFVDTYGVSLGRRYAEQARDYDEVYSSLMVVKNGVLPFVLRADPPIEPLVLRLTDVFFRLEHEVARRYYEAEKRQHGQFAELDVLKSGFMRLTTHELRRPLSVFRGYISMIESGDLGDLPEAVHKAIIQIAMSANEMAKLVDDLSAVRRLEEPEEVLPRPRAATSRHARDWPGTLYRQADSRAARRTSGSGELPCAGVHLPAAPRSLIGLEQVRRIG